MKKHKLTGKTVRKLHRLCRELEAANGIRLRWVVGEYRGRPVFWFVPVAKNDKEVLFFNNDYAFSVGEALENFYSDMAYLLNIEQIAPVALRWRPYSFIRSDCKPSRYSWDQSVYQRPGRHGKKVVLKKEN